MSTSSASTDYPTAEQLARALGSTKRSGANWKAICPCHDDHDPSLDIAHKNGKVVLICRAGCRNDDIIAALRKRGLWPEGSNGNGSGKNPTPGDEWHPIVPPPSGTPKPTEEQLGPYDMLHEYCGADDRILLYVRRHEAKGDKRKQFIPLTYGVLSRRSRSQ
jgi:rhodanese-related sulfurtransferase